MQSKLAKLWGLFLIGLSLSLGVQAKQEGQLNAFLEKFAADHEVSAAAVCVVSPNSPEGEIATFGTLSRRTTVAVNQYSFFPLGALTQPFTAMTLAHFVDLGAVDLDAGVTTFLPQSMQLPSFKGQGILIGDLATNTAALPNLSNTIWNLGHFTSSAMYRYLSNYDLKELPGSHWQVSNVGYAFLSNLISRVGKKSYHDLVREVVLEPLDLKDTTFVLRGRQERGLVMGYESKQTVSILKRERIYSVFLGANGLYSTPHDMLLWLKNFCSVEQSPLKGALAVSLKEYFDFSGFHLALPWKVIEEGSIKGKVYLFSSSMFGFTHFMAFIPDQHIGVCLLSNQEGIDEAVKMEGLALLKKLANH